MIIRSPWRHLVAACFFLSLAVILASLAFQSRFKDELRVVLEEENLRVARLAAKLVGKNRDVQAFVHETAELSDARITVVGLDGKVVADSIRDPSSLLDHSDRPEIVGARADGWGQAIRRSETLREDMIYTAVRVDDGAGNPSVFVRVARRIQRVEELTRSLVRTLWATSLVVILVGFLACYFYIEVRISREERVHRLSGEPGLHKAELGRPGEGR